MARPSLYRRYGVAILTTTALLLPLVGWGAYQAIRSNSNDVRDWLPTEYPETVQYRWFTQHFGMQDFIVASWPGCTLDDPRLEAFAVELTQRAEQDPESASFRRVVTGPSLLQQLSAPPFELNPQLVAARLRGIAIGRDGQQTCAVILLADEAADRLQPTIDLMRQAAEAVRVPANELRLGGIPIINAALNQESTHSLVRLASLSGLLGLVIAWFCFRELRLTLVVLAVGVFSAAASLAVVPLVGIPLNAILITMVPLVYVTAVSGAIHLSNYYLDSLEHCSPQEAPGMAVRHARVPLLLAALTTMLGLLSLGYSDLNPIRMFGVMSAVGVAIGSATQFLLLPAALAVWRPTKVSIARTAADDIGTSSHLGMWPKLGQWVVTRWGIVLTLCLAIITIGAIGLPQVHTSIQMMRLFSPGTPVIPMTRWLEEHLGATIPLEVVIRFSPDSQTTSLDRMRLVASVHGSLSRLPIVNGCVSAATFAPAEVTRSTREGILRRSMINARLASCSHELRESGWIAQDGQTELWRISLRVRGIDDIDYSALAQTLQRTVEPLCNVGLAAESSGVDFVITGTAPIVFKARQSLMDGMLFGLGTDIALIVGGVILITRSWLSGVIMLLVGVFPTVVVFGSMGLLGVVVDIGSVMTPCVAVGVTVDDVIHFMLCHRRGIRAGLSLPRATLLAYGTCGRAIVQSWGIIGVGLAAFALSSFVPTFRFGMLMLLLLTAGMLGNLLFLPSMLAGPLGRRMEREPTRP